LSEEDISVSSVNSLNIVSRKEIVKWTFLKTHSLQVLYWLHESEKVMVLDKMEKDIARCRLQPHSVSYSGGRRLNDSTSIQSVTFS